MMTIITHIRSMAYMLILWMDKMWLQYDLLTFTRVCDMAV